MPLLRVSAHPIPTAGSYTFCDQHKELWNTFWEEMDGDMDKILDFAEKAGVADPKEWYEELHRFLFDFFCGNPKILKNASKETFGTFISEIVKNHINDPKCDWWYHSKGLSKKQFIKALEMAADFECPKQAINHLNARVPDFGAKLYSEYLLSLTQKKSEIKSIASQKNQEAFKLEREVFGKTLLDNFQVGNIVGHSLFANDEFEVIDHEVLENKTASANSIPNLIVKNKAGNLCKILDIWNLE